MTLFTLENSPGPIGFLDLYYGGKLLISGLHLKEAQELSESLIPRIAIDHLRVSPDDNEEISVTGDYGLSYGEIALSGLCGSAYGDRLSISGRGGIVGGRENCLAITLTSLGVSWSVLGKDFAYRPGMGYEAYLDREGRVGQGMLRPSTQKFRRASSLPRNSPPVEIEIGKGQISIFGEPITPYSKRKNSEYVMSLYRALLHCLPRRTRKEDFSNLVHGKVTWNDGFSSSDENDEGYAVGGEGSYIAGRSVSVFVTDRPNTAVSVGALSVAEPKGLIALLTKNEVLVLENPVPGFRYSVSDVAIHAKVKKICLVP